MRPPRRRRASSSASPSEPRAPTVAVAVRLLPAWRDPWAIASALAVVPVVLHSLGAPLGEPFADDFDYLRRALLEASGSFFDGFGSVLYWRPLGRQVYYGALGRLMLAHPGAIAALHVVFLAVVALLLYRALRHTRSGPAAAAMASFPLWMESSRMLVAWPSHFMDLGALLFAALAIHEAAQRRLPTALAAMLGSLLCKEVGVVTALLLPWVPTAKAGAEASGRRWRWAFACAALVAVWTVAYVAASRSGHMALPRSFEPATTATPLPIRYGWALWHSVRACFSLAASPTRWDGVILVIAAAIAVAAFAVAARTGRLRGRRADVLWGVAWFLAASVALTEVYPAWAPYRAVFGSLGLGVVLVVICDLAHPALLGGLTLLRLGSFALSPGPPADVTGVATDRGAAFDFERLVRLERLTRDTRTALKSRFSSLPRHARVGFHYLPLQAEYAFAGNKSLQVWYGDTTARWVRFPDIARDPGQPLTSIVEFQPDASPQMVLVEPPAMKNYLDGIALLRGGEYESALQALSRADSLQRDRRAGVFLGSVMGGQGRALLGQGRLDEAERAARVGAALWSQNVFTHYVLGVVRYLRGDVDQAEIHIDSMLGFRPQDAEALRLKEAIRKLRARGGLQSPP